MWLSSYLVAENGHITPPSLASKGLEIPGGGGTGDCCTGNKSKEMYKAKLKNTTRYATTAFNTLI